MVDDVTRILAEAADGNRDAVDRLLATVYPELRALARKFLEGERAGHTLQPTALLHEAYLKLVDQPRARWRDRVHFFALAAQAMRRILIDHARTRKREKRGGGAERVALEAEIDVVAAPGVDLVALDDALGALADVHPTAARVIEFRYFGGLTIEEAAAAMGLSDSGVERAWRYARAFLFRALGGTAAVADHRRGD